jgi:hypothetical protein
VDEIVGAPVGYGRNPDAEARVVEPNPRDVDPELECVAAPDDAQVVEIEKETETAPSAPSR